MGHWYTKSGAPMHYVPNKSTGGTRDTNLTDAKKLNLSPSVTTILKVLDKPPLNRWIVDQALMSALTLPQKEGETLDEFKRRAAIDSKKEAREAAKIGTQIHDDIERVFKGLNTLVHHDIAREAHDYIVKLTGIKNGWVAEQSFSSPAGFGGKVDLFHPEENIVLDYKSKDIKDITKRMAYDENCMQLSAYSVGINMPDARLINVFVDRTEAGKVTHHEWNTNMYDRFECLLRYWQMANGHVPNFNNEEEAA